MQIDLKEAARLFNISEREMLKWVERRGVPVRKIQDRCMFNKAELVEWAASCGTHLEQAVPCLQDDRLPSLRECLEAGGVCKLAEAASKEEAFAEILKRMKLPPKTDRGAICQVLLARERTSSTGIGEGFAVPHVRNPLILNTDEPLINLCLLEKPLEFGAVDGKPVHALFTMISPNARLHLHLISRLALILGDASLKDSLKASTPDAEILDAIEKAETALAKRKA